MNLGTPPYHIERSVSAAVRRQLFYVKSERTDTRGPHAQEKVQALEAQVQELQARLAALNVEREQHKQQLAALSQRVTTVTPEPPPPPEEKPAEVRF